MPLQPGTSAFKPQAPITFGQPNPVLPQNVMSNTNAGSTTPFVISGLKATQPGGVNSTQTNTIKASQTAPASQQVATGSPTNTSSTAPTVSPTGGNPNVNYSAGVTPLVNNPTSTVPQVSNAGVSTAPTTASGTSGAPQTQQSTLQQIKDLIAQQDSQQSNLTGQEQTLTNNFTNMNAGILSQPGEIGYQTGRQAQLQQTEQTGLAALEGQQAQLAAYEQPQLSALTSVANNLTPQTVAPGQAVFNPGTGQYTNASSGGATPTTAPSGIDQGTWTQYINDFSTGNIGALPSSITGNANLYGQLQQAVSAQNPNFNYNTAVGQASGQQAVAAAGGQTQASNIQASGTAATTAAASGLQTATQNYVNANTAYTAAQNQAANLQQVLNSTGINANPQFVNQSINSLSNQLGSANYTSFITALTEMQQKYTTLLSTVGAQTPTINGQQATAILNPNSTPAQINAAIDALNNAAYAQLQPLYSQIGTYQSQLGSSNTTNSVSAPNFNF